MRPANLIKKFAPKSIRYALRDKIRQMVEAEFQRLAYMRSSPIDRYARLLDSMLDVEPWCLDAVQFNDDLIEIRGWAIPPQGNHSRVSFTVNDQEFDQIEYLRPREDIQRIFWYVPGAKDSGFVCRTCLPRSQALSQGYAVFKYIDKETQRPLCNLHNQYYCDNGMDRTLPVPDADRLIRVQGNDSESLFRLDGFTNYIKLGMALGRLGKTYADFSSLLDWGCGCGRLTRQFRNLPVPFVTGMDIDADNIQWCQKNLPFGRFLDISLRPPTNLASASFDLLIGISVFTHLREKEQFEWLNELSRIASDGAILLMTTLGDAAVCRARLDRDQVYRLREKGFLDVGRNPDLDKVIPENDYYRNVFHTRKYLFANWSRYYEIIEIIPGYIGNHQDLVVMRK